MTTPTNPSSDFVIGSIYLDDPGIAPQYGQGNYTFAIVDTQTWLVSGVIVITPETIYSSGSSFLGKNQKFVQTSYAQAFRGITAGIGSMYDPVTDIFYNQNQSIRPPAHQEDDQSSIYIRGNSLYTIVDGPSWTQAEANSVKLGGHLVTINDAGENAWIHDAYNLNPFWDRSGDVELFGGLYRESISSPWKWASGDSVSFTRWSNGEPSNGPSELYLALGWSDHYSWNDTYLQPISESGRPANSFPYYSLDMYRGIAEIPLTSSITLPTAPKEGAGVFTTSINLSAGTTTNLANGTTVYWKVSGITAEDLASGALTGSGAITNGKLDIQHSLKQDGDSGEKFEVSVFSDSGMTQQIGAKKSESVLESSPISITSRSVVARGNSLYTIVDGPSWTQAEANSVKLGGHLVTINDSGENDFISTSIRSEIIKKYNLKYGYGIESDAAEEWRYNPLIGYTDSEVEGKWKWVDGQNSNFTNWFPGEPNATGANSDYAAMYFYGIFWNSEPNIGSWDDTSGGTIGIAETPFIRRGDSAYVIVQGPTWEEAEANANKLGGHLVTINDAEENDWLFENGFRGWIGFTDREKEGDWKWTSGEPVTYTSWLSDSPSNTFGTEHYANNGSRAWGDSNNDGYGNFGPGMKYGTAEIKLSPNNTPTGTPTLSGNFKVGSTITIDTSGIQDADNHEYWTPTYSYYWEVAEDPAPSWGLPQWSPYKSIDALDGNSSLSITSDLNGKFLRGTVSYIDGYGSLENLKTHSILIETNIAKPSSPGGGGYLSFPGTDYNSPWSYVHIPSSNSLSIEGEISLSAWIYRENAEHDWRNLYDIPNAHLLEFAPNGGFDWRAENNNINFNINGPILPLGEWQHIAATMKSIGVDEFSQSLYKADLYVNGILSSTNDQLQIPNISTVAGGVRSSGEDLYLGILWSQRDGNPDPWAGGIDDFKIWNAALSGSEVYEVYLNNLNIRRENLVGEYLFNELSGNVVFDTSNYGNDGTIVGNVVRAAANSAYAVTFGLKLYEADGVTLAGDHFDAASWGTEADRARKYVLAITAESNLGNAVGINTLDATLSFNNSLFNAIAANDIQISNALPIANSVFIDNATGQIRIAAGSIDALGAGESITSQAEIARILLDVNDHGLITGLPNTGFQITANIDETIFSDLTSLRDRGGADSVKLIGENIGIEYANASLSAETLIDSQQALLGTDRTIGGYKFSNLIRRGSVIAEHEKVWTNTGEASLTGVTVEVNDLNNTSMLFAVNGEVRADRSIQVEDLKVMREDDGTYSHRDSVRISFQIAATGEAGSVIDISSPTYSINANGDYKWISKGIINSKNLITFQGDLNFDGRVSMKDLAYLNAGAARQQMLNGEPLQDSIAQDVDANFDNIINIADLAILDQDWGKSLHIGDQVFVGSDQMLMPELLDQGLDATWNDSSFILQNQIEASPDFIGSFGTSGQISSGIIGENLNLGIEDLSANSGQEI